MITDTNSKWKATEAVWPWKSYPRYFYGPCVLIPGPKIEALLAASQTTPYYHIDDLYITGLLPEKAKMEVIKDNE